ncbi:monooxygenase [Couchioplanes caeruleus]|uniref:monooxygenase n=1 Tax=Couchioplanes caeruleus TaxID=56438 RepID=UPI001FD4FF06|nr:monooxygenase [Couchioplanes caeruleus]
MPTQPLRAGERFAQVTMPEAYTPAPPAGGTDEYRCFLVDPGLTGDMFLTGSQFIAQNTDIVHHAIFFRIDGSAVAAARARDDAARGPGWTCFGDAGVGASAAWVASWAPGGTETVLSPDVGFAMPAGSRLVMQVHYSLLTVDPATRPTDRSGIRLRLTDKRLRPLHTTLLTAPVELPCTAAESGPLCDRDAAVADVARRFGAGPAATAGHLVAQCSAGRPVKGDTQHCDHRVKQAGRIHGIGGHMHLLGRAIRVELNPGTRAARTLLDIDAYDFDDQRLRLQAAPVAVAAGDTLRVTCTHDAGLRRQLPQLRSLPPRYVVWGEGTADEMCLGIIVGTHDES